MRSYGKTDGLHISELAGVLLDEDRPVATAATPADADLIVDCLNRVSGDAMKIRILRDEVYALRAANDRLRGQIAAEVAPMIDADGWVETFRHRDGKCASTEQYTNIPCTHRARAGSSFCQTCADLLDAVTPTLAYARTHRDEQVA